MKRQVIGFVTSIGALATARKVVSDLSGFESALIGVGKTTDLSGNELEAFGSSIVNLSKVLPFSAKELLNVGQTAGQLGVRGVDNLEKFITVVSKLGTATNLKGEEAATTLARILNVTGEPVSRVDQLGAAIVALGNNSAATEKEIAAVGESVAQSASVFKVSSADSLAFGAALASLGLEARLAGSTVGRAMREIDASIRQGGDQLRKLGDVAGMTGEEFEKAFRADSTQGLILFLGGIQKIVNAGGDAAKALEEFGLRGDEVLKVLPVLAQRVDYLADRVLQSREAFKENTALNIEFAKFVDALEQKLRLLGNTIAAALIENLKGIVPVMTEIVSVATQAIAILAGLSGATANASTAAKVLAEVVMLATTALVAFTAVKVLFFFKTFAVEAFAAAGAMTFFRAAVAATSIAMAVNGPLVAGITATSFAFRGLGLAIKSLYAAIGPAGWLMLGITAAIELWLHFRHSTDVATEGLDNMNKATVNLKQSVGDVETVFIRLARAQQLNDIGGQIQQVRALGDAYESAREQIIKQADLDSRGAVKPEAWNIPTVDVDELRKQFGESGRAVIDSFVDEFRKTDVARKINASVNSMTPQVSAALAR